MTRTKAKVADWKDVASELFDDEDRQAIEAKAQTLRSRVRAYRLAEVRRRQQTTQIVVADRMGVSQARVSEIERGQISRNEVETLGAYVFALGGNLRVVADFGDESITLA